MGVHHAVVFLEVHSFSMHSLSSSIALSLWKMHLIKSVIVSILETCVQQGARCRFIHSLDHHGESLNMIEKFQSPSVLKI